MPRSDYSAANTGKDEDFNNGAQATEAMLNPQVDPQLAELLESWDPVVDVVLSGGQRQTQWVWHGQSSWGSRAVAAFPPVAVLVAIVLAISTTLAAQAAANKVISVLGTGGAALLSGASSKLVNYRDVTFTRKSRATVPMQGSTSLALPRYSGWEANGSAGARNGFAFVNHGFLHVGVHSPTAGFAGWFLTGTEATPASCVFQFSAASPPAVAPAVGAIGELVMAVQTSNTIHTGDINYVVVEEDVFANGRRTLAAGYANGHLRGATEHILKRVSWGPGALHVSVKTNGTNNLDVWINGNLFLHDTNLHMSIVAPFEPYLEVQATHASYSVAFSNYSSVCQPNTVISNLPNGSVVQLDGHRTIARNGRATFLTNEFSGPRSGALTVKLIGDPAPVRFASHTYWPGDRYSFQSGT